MTFSNVVFRQADPFGSEIQSSGSGRRSVKGISTPEDLSNVDSKANILTSYPKEVCMFMSFQR